MDTALQAIVENIWISLLGLELERVDPDAGGGELTLAGCVHLSGAWQGSVALGCSELAARAAAAAMFGREAAELGPREIGDALAELTNIAAGGFKSLGAAGARASLPELLDPRELARRLAGGRVVSRLAFRCAGAPLRLEVIER